VDEGEEGEEEKEKAEEKADEEEQGELHQAEENDNMSSGWGGPRSIQYRFREAQPSILTVTPVYTQSSGSGIDYPKHKHPSQYIYQPYRYVARVD